MRLNNLTADHGSRKSRVRVGRGIGSGLGKTSGRGHKGQHARSGGSHKPGFEGGQMPIQRRLPKVGFRSRIKADTQQVFLYQLGGLKSNEVTLESLRLANLIGARVKKAKIVASGELTKALNFKGVMVTKGARKAIEDAGGSVE